MPLRQNFNKREIIDAVENNDELGEESAKAWKERVEPYIPYNTGRLCNDVSIAPFSIQYNAPYADTVYNDLQRNFRKDKHPLATAKWNEVAMPAVYDYWVQDVQKIVDRMKFDV